MAKERTLSSLDTVLLKLTNEREAVALSHRDLRQAETRIMNEAVELGKNIAAELGKLPQDVFEAMYHQLQINHKQEITHDISE